MAYVRKRAGKDGVTRFYARYLGADGKYHEEGGFASRRAAAKVADKRETDAIRGDWASPVAGRLSFTDYVEQHYWATTAHLEVSTRAAYRYYLDKHFLPRFGELSMRRIGPPLIQSWVNDASTNGLSARSVVKYHALLHKIFSRAVIDRVIPVNPCTHTALPKVVKQPKRIITVAQFEQILAKLPARYRMLVLLAIETGMRWGELIALRPIDIDLKAGIVTVRRTIVEVAKKNSPTGHRTFVKDYPKDDEQRLISIDKATCKQLREHMVAYAVRDTDLLFTSTAGTPLSRNNFRTKYWVPAIKAAKIEHTVTFHNLRAAHASWLLAGGADIIVVQERLGHRRIETTQQYTGTLPDAGERALAAFRKIRYGKASPETS
ncbi:MAG: tyrosine-type recombinase/integrase [Actinomycetes bacterium]